MNDTRRGFLAKLGAMATAPVLTAFVDDKDTGLAVPDRQIEVAKEVPLPVVISSVISPWQIASNQPMAGDGVRMSHTHMHNGDGRLVFFIDGEPWAVTAHRVPTPGQGAPRPMYRETGR